MLPYASLFCFAQVFLLGPSKLLLHQDTATVDTCLQDYLTTDAGEFISWRNDYLLQAPPTFHVTCPDLRLKDRQPGFNFSEHSGPHIGMLPYASLFCFAQVFLLGPSKLLLHQDTATVDTCLQDYLTTDAGDFISWRNDYLLQAPPPFHVTCPDLRLKDRQPGFNFSENSGPHIGMLPYASLFCFAQVFLLGPSKLLLHQDTATVDTCLQDYLTTDAGDFISWRNDYLLQAPPPFHVTCPDLRLKDRQPGFNFSGHSGPHIGMLPYASLFCFAQVFLLGPSKLLLHQDTATVDTCLQDYLTTDAGDFISWRNDYLLQAPPPFHVTCPDLRLKDRQPGFNFSGHSGPHIGMLPYASLFCFAQVFLLGPSKLLLHQDTATVDTCLQDYLTTDAGDFISWRNDYLLQAPPPFHVTCPDLRLKDRQPGFNFSGHSGPHIGMLPYASLFCFAQVFLLGPSKLLLHQDTATVDTCLQDYLTTDAGDFISWRNDYLLQAPPPFHVTCPDLRLKDRQPGFNFSGHSGPHIGMLPYASLFCFAQVFLLGPSKLLLHQDTATVDTCLQDYLTTDAGDFISWRNDYLLQAPPPFHVTCPDLRLKDRQPGFNFSGHSGPHIGMLPYASLFCFAQVFLLGPSKLLLHQDTATVDTCLQDYLTTDAGDFISWRNDYLLQAPPPFHVTCPDLRLKDRQPGFNFSGHSGPHIGMLPYASLFCFAQVFLLGPSKLLLHQDTATVDTCLQDYLTTDAGDFISWRNDYLLQAPPPFHVTCPDLRLKDRQPGFNFSGHSGPHIGMLPYASLFCFAQVFLLGPSKLLLHQDTATVDTCLQDYLTTDAGDFISWRNDYLLQAPPPFHVTCPDLRLKDRQPGFNFSGHSGPHIGMLPYASLFCFAQVFLLGPSKLLLHQDTATVDTCLQDYLTTDAGDFISWRNDYLLQAPPPFHVTCPDLRLKDRQPGFNFSGHSGPHIGMLPYASLFCFAQ
ncbi:hypothetical protein V5799_031974, partial [Amblyomma americanum]